MRAPGVQQRQLFAVVSNENCHRLLFYLFLFGLCIRGFSLKWWQVQLRCSPCLAEAGQRSRTNVNTANYTTWCHTRGPVMVCCEAEWRVKLDGAISALIECLVGTNCCVMNDQNHFKQSWQIYPSDTIYDSHIKIFCSTNVFQHFPGWELLVGIYLT